MDKSSRIYVAGHQGLVGSALLRRLMTEGYTTIVTRTMGELDLRNQSAVYRFFEEQRPEYVFMAAAKVGGIAANMRYPAHFIYDNLAIELNVIDAAYQYGVKKLLFLGSSCIYPRNCEQPIKEDYLLNGFLEQTNEPYAVAKIAGIKLCEAYNRQYGTCFISGMPTNLYGPFDNFDAETAHVVPALIRKFWRAKHHNQEEVVVWGTGTPLREFLFVDDVADACLFLMNNYNDYRIINIGTGKDVSIHDLAFMIKDIIDYKGDVIFDESKPDGVQRKLLNVERLMLLGWLPKTSLWQGLVKTVSWAIEKRIFE